jgi:hypothetical protein
VIEQHSLKVGDTVICPGGLTAKLAGFTTDREVAMVYIEHDGPGSRLLPLPVARLMVIADGPDEQDFAA